MGQNAAVCEHCGAAIDGELRYCRSCGQPTASAAAARAAANRTMLGVPAIGGSARSARPSDSAPKAARERDESAGDAPGQRGVGPPRAPMNRTMLGVGAPDSLPSVVASSSVPDAALPAHDRNSPSLSDTRPTRDGDETLLGGTAPLPGVEGTARTSRTSREARALPPDEDDGAPRWAPDSQPPIDADDYADSRRSLAELEPERKARWMPGIGALLLAVVALLTAGALGYVALRGRGPEVRVQIESGSDGESLSFQVPGAPKGARLRFGGQEQPLEAGRAHFPLGADSLRLGKNAVLFDVVYPNGKVEDGRVTIMVDYRVTLDTAPLRAGRAQVDVVVAAVLGSKVWLDGEPVNLDLQGRAVRVDPIDAESSSVTGQVEHVVRYRVEPPSGELSVGELRTSIPMTTMQIDRPGPLITTDQDSVEIAGVVDKDARVTIDGQPVNVVAGRFLHHFPLSAQGEYQPRLLAMAPGKAPRLAVLTLRRVDDLVQAANGYNPDLSLSYAKIAQNPAVYRGQRVVLEGRVYNAKVENGKSVLQMLVRECPEGERCPVWVTYGAATEFTVNSWVRVLGTVDGEQQFRAETDEVKSVPKVEAAFLLRAQP